jgi:hypothetical protein
MFIASKLNNGYKKFLINLVSVIQGLLVGMCYISVCVFLYICIYK